MHCVHCTARHLWCSRLARRLCRLLCEECINLAEFYGRVELNCGLMSSACASMSGSVSVSGAWKLRGGLATAVEWPRWYLAVTSSLIVIHLISVNLHIHPHHRTTSHATNNTTHNFILFTTTQSPNNTINDRMSHSDGCYCHRRHSQGTACQCQAACAAGGWALSLSNGWDKTDFGVSLVYKPSL